MIIEKAKKQAEEMVLFSMNLGDIETECRRKKIRVTKNRHTIEKKLIETLTKENIEIIVYYDMHKEEIEEACKIRDIKIVKYEEVMKKNLTDSLIKEYLENK